MLARYLLSLLQWDATDVLARVSVPTLVVVGDRDPTCVPAASERIGDRVLGATLELLAPGRHFAFIEEHAAFASLVREFVERHVTASPGAASTARVLDAKE